ncbi:MAG: hypothetical protein Alis3KO_38910 [Aliiglaciecola sp.]
MTLVDIVANALLFVGIGILALILKRFIQIPFTLILVLLGFAYSFVIGHFGWDTGIRANNFQDLMMFVLLPVLIFEAAFSLNEKLLYRFLPNILTMATVGLVISTGVTAILLFYGIAHSGFPIVAALLAGVVVSATDPVAVVSQLKQLGAPEDLNALIEGESLVNDATAIVLFALLLSIAQGSTESTILSGLQQFFVVLIGGILVGLILGFIIAKISEWMTLDVSESALMSIVLAYGSFYIAEHLLHVSGIVAVLCAALSYKRFAPKIAQCHYDFMHNWWQSLGYIANIFVFVLLGLVITLDMFTHMWIAMLIAIVAALVARIIATYFSVWINHHIWGEKLNSKYPPIMIWGGLRGAVTIALVLSLPTNLPYWWTIQSIGFGVVLFTLVFQATTTPLLIKKLKLSGNQ